MPRPGRGTFVAERAGDRAPTTRRTSSWQAVALGTAARRRRQPRARCSSCRRPARSRCPTGYLDPELQPLAALGAALGRAARRPAAWDRGPVEGREELRAWFAREAGGGLRAARHGRLPGRPVRARDRLPGARRAGRADPRRVADLPRRAGGRADGRSCAWSRCPTDADGVRPDAAGRGVRALGRAAALLPADVRQPARRHARARPPRRGARRRRARPARSWSRTTGRRDLAIDGDAPPPLAAADRRRPRRLHPLADQARGARAARRRDRRARRGRRAAAPRARDRRLLRVRAAAGGRDRARRLARPGGGTCARCAARCASAATRSPPRSSASFRRCG